VLQDLLVCERERELLAHERVALAVEPASEGRECRVSEGGRVATADYRRFVREHGSSRRPTAVDLADDVLDRNVYVGEEHLVEVRGAGDLAQGTNFDAWRLHVEQQE